MPLSFKFTVDGSDFSKEMDNLKKSTGNVKSELRNLTKEITNLEAGYRALSDEEKKSAFGEHLRQEISKGLEAAAQLRDVQGDISDNINKLASDTVVWDGLSEAISITRDTATAFASSLGIATKEGTLMGDTINTIAKAQGLANAAITIGNALQKNSKLMSAITTLQFKMQKAATDSLTASTGKLTVAQRLFNSVAKMNPYVLLASAVLGAITAISAYSAITSKVKKEEEAEKKIIEDKKESINAFNQSLETTIPAYVKLQNEYKKLRTEAEKQEWIKENKDNFHKLGVEINTTGDAENFFVKNTESVRQSFINRAKAAALSAQATLEYKKALESVNKAESGQAVTMDEALDMGLDRQDVTKNAKYNHGWFGNDTYVLNEDQISKARENAMKRAEQRIGKLYDEMTKSEQKAADKMAEAGVEAYRAAEAKKNNARNNSNNLDVSPVIGSLVYLENRLEKFKNSYKSGLLPKLSKESYLKQVQEFETEISQKKIELGLEMPKSKIEQLNEELKKARKDLEFTIEGSADEEQIKQNIREILDKIEKENLRLTVKTELKPPTDAERAAIQEEINNIINDALKVETPEYDFSNLPDEFKKSGDELLKQIDNIKNGQEELNKIINDPESNDTQISKATDAYKELGDILDKLLEKAGVFQELSDATGILNEDIESVKKTCSSIGDIANAVGSAFNGMADAFEMPEFNVFGTIAQAVANMALSYSSALGEAGKLGPIGWITFAATGLAQLMAIIASVKNATKFAEGGVVKNGPTSGDKILARLNAGELVLNKKQQETAWNLMNSTDSIYDSGVSSLGVTSVKVKGSDLILAISNELKTKHKKTIL